MIDTSHIPELVFLKRREWRPEPVLAMPVSGCVTRPTEGIRMPLGKGDDWWYLHDNLTVENDLAPGSELTITFGRTHYTHVVKRGEDGAAIKRKLLDQIQ